MIYRKPIGSNWTVILGRDVTEPGRCQKFKFVRFPKRQPFIFYEAFLEHTELDLCVEFQVNGTATVYRGRVSNIAFSGRKYSAPNWTVVLISLCDVIF